MREWSLLRELDRSYRRLGLSYGRLIGALLLMLFTAVLEMVGLSILYPLVLVFGGGGPAQSPVPDVVGRAGFGLGASRDQIGLLIAGVIALNLIKNVVLYFTYRNNMRFAMYYYKAVISALYDAYVHKPLGSFRQESAGSISNIICVQSGRLVDGVVRPLLVGSTELVLLVLISVLMFWISPLAVGIVVISCGLAGVLYYRSLRHLALGWGRMRMAAATELQEIVSNTARGVKEVKIFAQEDYMTTRVRRAAKAETDMFCNLEMYQQGPRFLIEGVFMLGFGGAVAVYLAGGVEVAQILARVSVIAAASLRILPSINRLVNCYSNLSFNLGPAMAVLGTINQSDRPRGIPDPEVAAPKEMMAPLSFATLELRQVVFRYGEQTAAVLQGASAKIHRGEKIGIFGHSGSGKSTIIELMATLYVPDDGAILVDGHPLHEVRGWRRQLGYVPQQPFILPGSIRENLQFGSDRVISDNELWEVLRLVGLHDYVRQLDLGLDTPIGEKYRELSGGQRQLCCIARAFCRTPALFLLDEPTAALDQANEALVMRALEAVPADATVVMVSHKLANFSAFDAIYECVDGRLVRRNQLYGSATVTSSSTQSHT